jgi:hypothetical protein
MATVPFEFACNKEAGFVMNPNEHPRVGYVTAFDGLSGASKPVDLEPDMAVADPLAGGKQTVVGVIEKFSWAGGVGDPLMIDFWTSQENAVRIKGAQQLAPEKATVQAVNFNVVGFDPESKAWFTQLAPQQPVGGTIAGGAEDPQLNVDLTGAPVKDGIDVMVYKVTMAIAPAANQFYSLHFANSINKPVVKAWGLQVGTLASGAVPKVT